jgi:hypothetical protein
MGPVADTGRMFLEILHLMSAQIRRDAAGRIADFCPICRDFTPARLFHVRVGRPLQLWSGDGRTVEFVRVCERCETEIPAEPATYASTDGQDAPDTDALLLRTQPDAVERWSTRLALEDRVLDGTATREDREQLLAEPVFALNRQFEIHRCIGPSDPRAVALYAAAVASAFAGMWIFFRPGLMPWSIAGAAGALLFWALGLTAARHGPRRYVEKVIEPKIVAALRPLQPCSDELARLCRDLARQGVTLADVIKPAKLEAVDRAA